MHILFMGTGPFAVPAFSALLDGPHEAAALVTRPERQHAGRKGPPVNPMRSLAEARGVAVHAPESINDAAAHELLRRLAADLFIVCDYGQILSNETLALAPYGGVNLHGSLLPKYRGAAPVQWAVYHGETTTGVTVIHMTPRLDAGPCLVQRALAIEPEETAAELEIRLAELGGQAVLDAIALLEQAPPGAAVGQVQIEGEATKAPRLKKTDGLVDWSRSAEQIVNQVRAFTPWPGVYTHFPTKKGEPLRVILAAVEALPPGNDPPGNVPPGSILRTAGDELFVATSLGTLAIRRLQPAGKRVMAADEFLRGHALQAGEQLT